ncbi:hypothetical protein [Azospirillum doebereinerae]|uniref:hypothetical protein n=1 Tax=Azospirillum doebereinerae TaxID=92933 RepID=UPI00163BA2DA|nr:hypothetical protein [Azospirillum doebereinerae]MCG5243151.1 hypothetical protein [Azospirillum doebereinerae]
MSDNDALKPGEAELAIERAMQQKPKAMLVREKLQRLLDDEHSARQLMGAIRGMMRRD